MAEYINFYVAGEIPEIAQPTDYTCWAATCTMMLSWRDQTSYSIESALDSLGGDFRQMFDDPYHEGLLPDRNEDFANATSLILEYPRCETPVSILHLLKSYGPLLIIDDEAPNSPTFIRHARIIIGIDGESDISKTYLSIINPDGGITEDELFETFAAKYEALADDERYKIQMMHF